MTWSGEADVDLSVEEPTGTVCSHRSPRTTAGGVMMGDGYARFDGGQQGEYRESYVCSQGFEGEYRLLLRRVWGKLPAGKVTVDVVTNYGSKNEKHERRQIELGSKDAVVAFQLPQGQRKEELAEHQVNNAAHGQLAVGRAILAQQLNALSNPAVTNGLSDRPGTGGTSPFDPRFRQSAVGFQPVIITLPEGTNFAVTGVISADRRYVRVTSIPLFSGIGDVTVFHIGTGQTQMFPDSGNGGVGGN